MIGTVATRRRVIVAIVGAATALYLVWLVVAHWREIDRALLRFGRAQTRWLVAAIAFEILSQGCAVAVQHHLLRRAGSMFAVSATVRLVLTQNAIGLAVPGGQAVASVYSYRQIRRHSPNSTSAAWVVAASNLVAMVALATFAAFTATGASWLTALSAVGLVVVLVVLVIVAHDPGPLIRPAASVVRFGDRLRRRRSPDSAEARVAHRFERLSAVRMRWNDWLLIAAVALVAVAADCAVWICATHAIVVLPARCLHTAVSVRVARQCASFRAPSSTALLLAYSAGQAALQLPLLPGGIGLVESVMTATLTTSKVRALQALSAVLLYRVISFWSIIAAGAVIMLAVRRRGLNLDRGAGLTD